MMLTARARGLAAAVVPADNASEAALVAGLRVYPVRSLPEAVGIAGSAEHVAEQLRFYVERGAELVILWFQDLADTGSGESTAERFMRDVAPRLRHA